MLPSYTDVSNGQANGTQPTFEKVVLKPGQETQHVLLNGEIPVPAVLVSQVSYIVLCHTNDPIRSATFSLKCKQNTFKAKKLKPIILQVKGDERKLLQMKGSQLSLLISKATTGH
jgi:hypothetical protein